MVDYSGIGAQIRALRKERNMTQEQLAEAAGLGATHVSHVENGTTKLSVRALIAIINALDCSADELLCVEVAQAKAARSNWITPLVEDCNEVEVKLITDTIIALKRSMRQMHLGEE